MLHELKEMWNVHTVLSAFAPNYRKREVAKKATARIDPADYPSLIFML